MFSDRLLWLRNHRPAEIFDAAKRTTVNWIRSNLPEPEDTMTLRLETVIEPEQRENGVQNTKSEHVIRDQFGNAARSVTTVDGGVHRLASYHQREIAHPFVVPERIDAKGRIQGSLFPREPFQEYSSPVTLVIETLDMGNGVQIVKTHPARNGDNWILKGRAKTSQECHACCG